MVALAESEKPVMTEPEAAAFLTISPSKLYKMNKAGEIQCLRAGRRKMYDRRVLLAWMDSQKSVLT